MATDFTAEEIVRELRRQASHLIDQGFFEEAISQLKRCLSLEDEPDERANILCELGFCFLRMGWHEDAVRIFSQHLQTNSFDNDARFYLASAYASMGWTNESVTELRKILASDPTDVLAYHALALCYRDRHWLQEALEIMKAGKEQAAVYGNQEEKEIVEESLADLEKDIKKGGEDKLRERFLLIILLAILKKRSLP
jgi:Tfp pilus assembly protein PilF